MKHTMEFEKVLKSFDTSLKKTPHPKDNPQKLKEFFQTYLEQCHPFVFLPEQKDSPAELDYSEEMLDLPYPCMHIEVQDSFITVPKPEDYAIDGMTEFTPSYLGSFIVREMGPREYRFLLNMYSKSGQPIMIECGRDENRGKMMELFKFANSLLKIYLERLNREKIGVEKQEGVRHLGEGKNKKFYKLRPITHVSPKTTYVKSRSVTGKEIDWSHRWEVRGHWRTVKGVGKDREGNYIVKGFTWISNFVKGPETAPLIKKTYVVG
jgi:hypothetical protein